MCDWSELNLLWLAVPSLSYCCCFHAVDDPIMLSVQVLYLKSYVYLQRLKYKIFWPFVPHVATL